MGSCLTKPNSDLTWPRIIKASVEHENWMHLGASEYRPPPVDPETFAAKVAQMIFTNGRTDCELVAKLYAETLVRVLGKAETLEFRGCTWGDEELRQLARVLPLASALQELWLDANDFIEAGYDALATVLEDATHPPKLKVIIINDADVKKPSTQRLRSICSSRGIRVTGGF